MEGISKERLHEIFENESALFSVKDLIHECKELDPWLPIDENTPKDKELAFITKEYGKVIGKWFSVNDGGWWVAACMPVTPTHYKELPEDPK